MKVQTIVLLIIVAVLAATGGWFFAKRQPHTTSSNGSGRKILYYQSAMHPWIKSDKPGNCTICGMKLTPVYEGDKGFEVDPNVVALSSNVINVINVQTQPVERRPLERMLDVAGRIESDETRYRIISAYVDGRIEKLFVNYIGADVQQGEPLATIYSPALLTAEREYLTVLNQTNLAGSERLGAEHERMLEGARQRLKRLGLQDEQIAQLREKSGTNYVTQVTAPISGTVVNRAVYEGQYVKEGDKLFEIADFSVMWFRFDVYEQDLPWIKLGQIVRVSSPALGGQTVEGPITFIDPNINEATRSAKVRVELKNPAVNEGAKQRRALYNNLYAEGHIQVGSQTALAVPRSAVLQPGDEPRVYVETGGAYEPRVVKLGRKGEDYWEILEGVEQGERVVTTGNLLIDSQAQFNKGGAAHEHAPRPRNDGHKHSSTAEKVELSEEQLASAKKLFGVAHQINAGLAADDVKVFNANIEHLKHAIEDAAQKLAKTGLAAAVQRVRNSFNLQTAKDLESARKEYAALSGAIADFAQALRRGGVSGSVKVFQCPMFPAPGKTAYWVQTEAPLRNPFYGSKMLDCGTEVK